MTTEQDCLTRISALRTMTFEQYESVIDELVAELDTAGVLPQYDALLLEIDESFDTEHDAAVKELMDTLSQQNPDVHKK